MLKDSESDDSVKSADLLQIIQQDRALLERAAPYAVHGSFIDSEAADASLEESSPQDSRRKTTE